MNLKKGIKELIDKYPFLLPRNVWSDELDSDYDYSYCWFKDDIPQGWWERWGLAYLDDLKEVLEKYNYVDKFRFSQVKEKFGGLRAYNFGQPKEWDSHELAWEYISKHTCINCGMFPVPMRHFWWVSPYCDYHAFKVNRNSKEEIDNITEKNWDGRVQEYLIIKHFNTEQDDYKEWIDMKPFYNKIGWEYTEDDLILKDELLKIIEEKENGKK